MGNTRAQLKLINAAEESLARCGQLPPEQMRACETEAPFIAGAVRTVLPTNVVKALGLEALHQEAAKSADGRERSG
ncbi:hypothetical protein [Pyrinomonas sp.]|uniref:hypothetical protein n=1 Tax=Pyrinomonas sp. TaxID=2080306 RepID=UPI00332A2F84